MRSSINSGTIIWSGFMLCFSAVVCAQGDQLSQNASSQIAEPVAKVAPVKLDKSVPIADKDKKKMLQEATINLQTTVTGNQEQPRVLYILPWQSPAAEDVDFETLNNQQQAVFNHVEREELRRELQSSSE